MNKTKAQIIMHDLAVVVSVRGYGVKIDIAEDWYTFTIHDHGLVLGRVKTDGDCVNLNPPIEEWGNQMLAWIISERFVGGRRNETE